MVLAGVVLLNLTGIFLPGSKGLAATAGLILSVQCIGSLTWVITGMVLGWRQSGNICSMGALAKPQDPIGTQTPGVLYASGKFINVMNIIHVSLLGCVCCLACIGITGGKVTGKF